MTPPKPIILALDASSDACSVAIANPDGTIRETVEVAAREHTQRILPMVASTLLESVLTLKDLDAIAFGRGPGSFTGLRICLSIAQGLAYGADLPLIGISSLAAMANKAFRQHSRYSTKTVIPLLDARMEEVYWSAYRLTAVSEPESLVAEQVASPERAAAGIRELIETVGTSQQLVGIGPGWHYPVLASLPMAAVALDYYPSAYDVAELAVIAFARGETTPAHNARPHYLRDEITWKKRQRIRQ